MSGKIYPEDKEAAKIVYDKIKGESCDTISLFEAVTALRQLGIETDTDTLYKENKQWDIGFDRFCDIFGNKKEEKDMKELRKYVSQSFEALGGKPNQQGMIDIPKLQEVFKFFDFDLTAEDFLLHGQYDTSSNILFDDYMQIFDMNSHP